MRNCRIKHFKACLGVWAAISALTFFYGCGSNDKVEKTKPKQDTDSLKTKLKTSPYAGSKVILSDDVQNGNPVNVTNTFNLIAGKKTIAVGLDLRPINKKIGSNRIDLRLMIKKDGSEKLIETLSFDTQPEWDIMYFNGITFYQTGKHRVVFIKPDGTPVASAELEFKE